MKMYAINFVLYFLCFTPLIQEKKISKIHVVFFLYSFKLQITLEKINYRKLLVYLLKHLMGNMAIINLLNSLKLLSKCVIFIF